VENGGGRQLATETTKEIEIEKETANAVGIGEYAERDENEFSFCQGGHRRENCGALDTGQRLQLWWRKGVD